MKDGIYLNLDENEYHNGEISKNTVSRSELDMIFFDSPRSHYLKKTSDKNEKTDAMMFGTIYHQMILENDKFCENYPDRESLLKQFSGKKMAQDNTDLLEKMHEIYNIEGENSTFKEIVKNSYKEVTIITRGKRCRLDLLAINQDGSIEICDLKTTREGKFFLSGTSQIDWCVKRMFDDQKYAFQLCFYGTVLREAIGRIATKDKDFHSDIDLSGFDKNFNIYYAILLASKMPPYRHAVAKISENTINIEKNAVNNAMRIFSEQYQKHKGYSKIWDDLDPDEFEFDVSL